MYKMVRAHPFFTTLYVHRSTSTISTNTSFLYTLPFFSLPYFYIQPSLQSPQKVYSSTTEPIQTATMVQRAMTFCGDWHFWSLPDFLKHGQGEKCSKSLSPYWSESENAVLQVVASVEDTCDQNSKLSTRPSPISTYHDFHTLLTSS